jgi:simple sugar transport system substrate-binding protein
VTLFALDVAPSTATFAPSMGEGDPSYATDPRPSDEKDVVFRGAQARAAPTFFSVTHDMLGDPFWAVYRRGLRDAAERFECTVHHLAPEQFSPEDMVAQLEAAIAAEPDGVLSTVPDAAVVEGPLRRAIESGIPVIAVNAADPRPPRERIPYMLYIGADDVLGGETVARRLLEERDMRRALCVDHYLVEHTCHNDRCSGFSDAMRKAGVAADRLRVPGSEPGRAVRELRNYLTEHEVDAICTLGPPGAAAVVEAVGAEGLHGRIVHASFDLAPEQLEAIKAGHLLFTIDSQQYLQAFLGIELLALHLERGFTLGGDVLTGPALVDRRNVEQVAAGVAAGWR